jgi:hypothetical protein
MMIWDGEMVDAIRGVAFPPVAKPIGTRGMASDEG